MLLRPAFQGPEAPIRGPGPLTFGPRIPPIPTLSCARCLVIVRVALSRRDLPMSRYAKRLDRDLVRWREAGFIDAKGEAGIRRELSAQQASKLDLAHVLGILGAVLIGFGFMSFVAAHWSEMP